MGLRTGSTAVDEFLGLTVGTIENVTITNADQEYSHTFPQNTKLFSVRARQPAVLRLSYAEGESGTVFKTIPAGADFERGPGIEADEVTIYVQSTKPNVVLELESWS